MHPASLPYLFHLNRTQWWRPEALEALQWRRMRALLHHAYDRVPYYRDLFDGAGVTPADIRVRADLQHIPVTTKEALRDVPAATLTARGVDPGRCIERHTSGTTGTPVRLLLSRRQKEAQDMAQARAMLANGLRLRDRRAVFVAPWHIPTGSHWFQRLGLWRKDHYSVFEDVDACIDRLEASAPDSIAATPALLRHIAEAHLQHPAPRLAPRTLFSSADLLDAATRARVEHGLGAPVVDLYGALEFGYIAWQCPLRQGYHINVENVLLEFCGSAQDGEVIATNLLAEAMPLIRYRLGDLCAPAEAPCPCGRGLPTLRLIQGRANDVVQLADGRRITPQALAESLAVLHRELRQFRVEQRQLDAIRVLVVPERNHAAGVPAAVEAALRAALGERVRIDVETVTAIPADASGKRRAIVSQLDRAEAERPAR